MATVNSFLNWPIERLTLFNRKAGFKNSLGWLLTYQLS